MKAITILTLILSLFNVGTSIYREETSGITGWLVASIYIIMYLIKK